MVDLSVSGTDAGAAKLARVAVFEHSGKPMTITTVAIPPLREGEILVETEYTTLCGSDIKTVYGKRNSPVPTILGHEVIGRIAALYDAGAVRDSRNQLLQVGDRITWSIYASDPASDFAKAGIPQKGEGLFKYGHEVVDDKNHLHGGLSDHCIVRKNTEVAKVSPDIPAQAMAPVNCAIATIMGGFRLAGNVSGQRVLIIGAGMLGIVASAIAKLSGASRVIVLDIDDSRLQKVTQFGADHTMLIAENTTPKTILEHIGLDQGVEFVFELSGTKGAMENSVDLLRIGGEAVWIGGTYPQPPLAIDGERVVRNLLQIKGLHNYNREDFLKAVEFMEHHHETFPFKHLVEKEFSLGETNQAFNYALHEKPIRVGIRCGS